MNVISDALKLDRNDTNLRWLDEQAFWKRKAITPPVHVKSLLEEAQLDPDVSNKRCAELYVKACRDYLDSKLPGQDSWETWKSIVTQIGKIGGIK